MSDKVDPTPEKNQPSNSNAEESENIAQNVQLEQEKATKSALTIAVSKNTKILALFAIACTLAVGLVSELTKDEIKKQEQQHLLKTLHSIIEPSRYDNDIANDCIMMSAPELGTSNMHTAYIARKSGQVIAVAITSTAPKGYNGNIDFIMAINNDGSVSGVRVLKHQETPGLGDKVELRKSDWVTSFNGKKLLSPNDSRWAVSKDNGMFDQFTGATITPRAVVEGVKSTLNYFTKNKGSLLTRPNACGEALLRLTDTASSKQTTTPPENEAANEQ
ncbi:electron transport complex subunit RsxG [Colwellia psychrerythraea]|uniref:Ion-translocating oxidoreductase complex subunit G n=1 Tax=Colwellia psychrerythraea TaxID=28229 RepID=A0A099KCM7_COLPS|nr:electron transport complex subunit RsxG [Colwellia psychrerythraea]KGJ87792.1 electron transport complex, RnfABCDGE type, G subunit [Colwellia psychrerythraea]